MVKSSTALLLLCAISNVYGDCGHDICIAEVSRSSYCKRDTYTCHGAPTVSCDCNSKAIERVDSMVTQAEPQRSYLRNTPIRADRSNPNGDGIFLWLEWPSMTSSQWKGFYENVLSFMRSNCGGFRVSRVIARVLRPDWQADSGKLWQVGTDSIFYTEFLAKVPAETEIYVYPYLFHKDHAPAHWTDAMGTATGLEGVYKYVSQWNHLLASVRPEVRISGIVTDYEEHKGFDFDLPNIPGYRQRYSTPGQAPLRFGSAFGYDQPYRAGSLSDNIEDIYLEFYDWYKYNSAPAVLVQQGSRDYVDNVSKSLDKLDRDVWSRYLKGYNQSNIHFMWSLQSTSSKDCLYPLGDKCGTKEDFGTWSAPKVAEFIKSVKERHPEMSFQPHGFYEFSYMPRSWMSC